MRAKDLIKVYLQRDGVIQDITDGILTIETASGVDNFEGIWQTPEVGQFRIVSRSPDIDPYVNTDMRYNSRILIESITDIGEQEVFTGYVTDINVEYRPNDDPIVTINGTDIIGLLNRTVITQSHINAMKAAGYLDEDGIGDCFSVANWFGEGNAAEFPYYFGLFTKYQLGTGAEIRPFIEFKSRAMPKPGETVWDFTSKLIASDLSYAYVTPDSNIFIAPHYKYDAGYYPLKTLGLTTDEILNQEASIHLSSDPNFDFDGQTGFGYKAININDGFDRTVNQVTFTSTTYADVGGVMTETTSEFTPIVVPSSIDEWGPAELSLDIYRPGITTRTQAFPIASDIMELSATPKLSVASVTIDGTKAYKTGYSGIVLDGQTYYHNFTPSDQVKIYHKINDSLFINNLYTVVGVKNEINETDWRIELILRQSEIESYLEKAPEPAEFTINPTSGTTATNFTGTVTNYTTGQFTSIEWMPNNDLLVLNPNPPSVTWPNLTPITGLSASWNYDDDGPLKLTGEYGAHDWAVGVWVDVGGWKTLSLKPLTVTPGPVSSSFTYAETAFYGIRFTDTSINAEEWLWDFGDGTTSTEQNPPTKYYATSGTKTVSLTVSDGISSVTSTQNIPVVIPPPATPLPIRYIRVKQSKHQNNIFSAQPNYTEPKLYSLIDEINVKNSSGTILSANKPVISLNNYHGILSTASGVQNQPATCYSNQLITKFNAWNIASEPLRITNQTGTYISVRSKAFSDWPGDCQFSEWDLIIDLQTPVTTISSLEIKSAWTSQTTNPLPTITFEGSADLNDWIELGVISGNRVGNGTVLTVTATPSRALPPVS